MIEIYVDIFNALHQKVVILILFPIQNLSYPSDIEHFEQIIYLTNNKICLTLNNNKNNVKL